MIMSTCTEVWRTSPSGKAIQVLKTRRNNETSIKIMAVTRAGGELWQTGFLCKELGRIDGSYWVYWNPAEVGGLVLVISTPSSLLSWLELSGSTVHLMLGLISRLLTILEHFSRRKTSSKPASCTPKKVRPSSENRWSSMSNGSSGTSTTVLGVWRPYRFRRNLCNVVSLAHRRQEPPPFY